MVREYWMEAKGFPYLLVSNFGNVKYALTGEEPSIWIHKGRKQLNLTNEDGWNVVMQLHRLIAGSFFEDSIEGYEINHIDGDRTNNAVWNLEFNTHEQNRDHAYQLGIMHKPVKILNIDTGEEYSSMHEAGLKLGYVSPLAVPKQYRESGEEFIRRGYRLRVV